MKNLEDNLGKLSCQVNLFILFKILILLRNIIIWQNILHKYFNKKFVVYIVI